MSVANLFNRIGQVGLGVALVGGVVNSALYNGKWFYYGGALYLMIFILCLVDGGHRAVIFDRFTGIKKEVVGEGTHFFIPWVQRPIIFDVRSRPRNVPVITGSKGNHEFFVYLLFSSFIKGISYFKLDLDHVCNVIFRKIKP